MGRLCTRFKPETEHPLCGASCGRSLNWENVFFQQTPSSDSRDKENTPIVLILALIEQEV
jgi:hypothetical protein